MSEFAVQFARLMERHREMARVGAAKSLLEWDSVTDGNMPSGAEGYRTQVTAHFQDMIDAMVLDPSYERLVRPLASLAHEGRVARDSVEHEIIAEAWDEICWYKCVPQEFLTAKNALLAESYFVWERAYKARRWSEFLPMFERIVSMQRREVECLSANWHRMHSYRPFSRAPQGSPYDWLLDSYDSGMTAEKAGAFLGSLVGPLSSLVRRVGASSVRSPLPESLGFAMEVRLQESLNRHVAARIGYDFSRGLLGRTVHPFCALIHPGDSRIATRYVEADALDSLYGTIHEAGHGMYDQAMPPEWFGTHVGQQSSYGLHESRSRMWENIVGKSRPFCEWLHDEIGLGWSDNPPSADALYRTLNAVRPTYVRTEADEVTYNLHVALRFEIERDLMERTLEAGDVFDAWRVKLRDYLGLEIEHDGQGPLQDSHWSAGMGYFPSYAFGNVWGAQIFAAAERDIPGLQAGFARGEFAVLKAWLRDRMDVHAGRYEPEKVVALVTGEEPSTRHFLAYLEKKYGELYQL